MATKLQEGAVVDYTPASDVAAGDVVVQNDLVGVAPVPIAANALGVLAVTGIYDFAKSTASAISAGAKVYWDDSNDQVVTSASGNTYLGKAVAAEVTASTKVKVRLDQ